MRVNPIPAGFHTDSPTLSLKKLMQRYLSTILAVQAFN